MRKFSLCYMPMDAEFLILGNGNSMLPERLVHEGFSNITCIDTSAVVCEIMGRRLDAHPDVGGGGRCWGVVKMELEAPPPVREREPGRELDFLFTVFRR